MNTSLTLHKEEEFKSPEDFNTYKTLIIPVYNHLVKFRKYRILMLIASFLIAFSAGLSFIIKDYFHTATGLIMLFACAIYVVFFMEVEEYAKKSFIHTNKLLFDVFTKDVEPQNSDISSEHIVETED